MTYLGLVFYLLFCIVYIVNQFSMPQKTPLKYTKRMSRMIAVYAILIFALSMLFLKRKSTTYILPKPVRISFVQL